MHITLFNFLADYKCKFCFEKNPEKVNYEKNIAPLKIRMNYAENTGNKSTINQLKTDRERDTHTCTGRPATSAYASACGTVVRPTVRPASRSIFSHLSLYLGSQVRTGNKDMMMLWRKQPWLPAGSSNRG